jgi:hypothetical protein
MVEILCIHVWKWKNEAYWNYSKNGGENGGGGELYVVSTFVHVTMYPQYNNNII